MADVQFATNLLPQYQSPQQMAQMAANTANTQASTGLLGAQTGLVGAQATGADIQNRGALIQYQMMQKALSGGVPDASQVAGATPTDQGGPPTPSDNAGASGHPDDYPSVDAMQAHAQQTLAPLPVQFTPQEQQWVQRLKSTGNPLLSAQADAFTSGRVAATQNENAKRQYTAQKANAISWSIVDAADKGIDPFATLNRYNPEIAKGIAAQHPDDFYTDSAGNVQAKPSGQDDVAAYARSTVANTYLYTGRESTMQNGQLVDVKSGRKVPGVDQILPGLTGAERQKAWDAAIAPTIVKNSDGTESQIPAYQASQVLGGPKFNSPWDMVAAADKAARASTTGSPSAGTSPGMGSSPSQSPGAIRAPASVTTDPVLKSALADPDYKISAPTVVAGRTATPAELDQQKATVEARTDLLKDSQQATSTAAQSLMYTKAAQALMASGGNVAGLGAENRALVSRFAQTMGLSSGVNATNYQELAKYLGNAALQGAKQSYGSKMTESEVKLQMEELSPDVAKTPDAINHLLDNNAKNLQYTIDSARRTKAYLATGGDPQTFADWNQKYYPREKVIGPAQTAAPPARPGQQSSGAVQTATGPNGQKMYLRNGQWVAQ